MKIGLYFGSFNPIHVGHLIIANHCAEFTHLDQVWLVVTPQNPLKNKQSLLHDRDRLHLVFLTIEDYPKLKTCDIEFKMPQPNYTINTLAQLTEQYPEYDFSLIMGEDNLKTLHKWKNFEQILKRFPIFVYPRVGVENEVFDLNKWANLEAKITFVKAPIVEISATFIRENIKLKKNVQPLLPSKVWEYIDYNNLYR